MAGVEAEKSSYGVFERFLYIFFIPSVFTVIFIGVMLFFSGYDVVNPLLTAGNKIPGVKNFVPDPNTPAPHDPGRPGYQPGLASEGDLNQQIEELQGQLAGKETELELTRSSLQLQEAVIEELQSQLAALEESQQARTLSEEEYQQRIQSLASTYARMLPSRAAPIMENLGLHERVLILQEMRTDDRVKVLEKMNPRLAAETSIMLKDVVPAADRQIAALQERLQMQAQNESDQTPQVTVADLAETFANMQARSAASLLLEMTGSNQGRVISILSAMDNVTRSRILTAMTEESREQTTQLIARLGQ